MEKKRPLISTILFIGIFLIGLLFVLLFASKALNDEQVSTESIILTPVERVS